jgi:hypothetical protein
LLTAAVVLVLRGGFAIARRRGARAQPPSAQPHLHPTRPPAAIPGPRPPVTPETTCENRS